MIDCSGHRRTADYWACHWMTGFQACQRYFYSYLINHLFLLWAADSGLVAGYSQVIDSSYYSYIFLKKYTSLHSDEKCVTTHFQAGTIVPFLNVFKHIEPSRLYPVCLQSITRQRTNVLHITIPFSSICKLRHCHFFFITLSSKERSFPSI